MMAHYHHAHAAEENWEDADEATPVDAAIYHALMAQYEATVEMVGFLDTIAAGIANLDAKLDKL